MRVVVIVSVDTRTQPSWRTDYAISVDDDVDDNNSCCSRVRAPDRIKRQLLASVCYLDRVTCRLTMNRETVRAFRDSSVAGITVAHKRKINNT